MNGITNRWIKIAILLVSIAILVNVIATVSCLIETNRYLSQLDATVELLMYTNK